jgi:diguanylate cyclase (GGDEF)-like protein
MLFIDLDDFKQVNDRHGHAVGDKLLQQLAARLADLLPEGGVAARIGGDEFVVLLRAISAEETEELAQHLTNALSAFYDVVGEQPLGIGVSVGAAVTEGVGISLEDLLARSDKALYAAKLARKGKPIIPSIEDGIRDLWDILERIPEAPLAKAS